MEFNKDLVIALIGYFLSIFFSPIGLIYGVILYFLKKDSEMYYEHSRNIIAVGALFIILRLFASIGSFIF
jgi:hypothetical protein